MLTTVERNNVTASLRQFWEVESIGITETVNLTMSQEEEYAAADFSDGLNFDGRNYEERLPRKKDHPKLERTIMQVGMIADEEKMYLQIKLAPKDQDVPRYLRTDEAPNKTTFGVNSSPCLAIATVHAYTRVCPSGWIHMQGSCYKFSTQFLNWNAAKSACEALGSKLVVINSKAEQQALAPKTSVKTYWIGLYRDPKDKSRWMWVDGSRPGYTAWRTGEPNNWMGQGVEEDCTEMYVTWNDLACKSVAPYICEIDANACQKLSLRSGVQVSPSHCLSSNQKYGSTCSFTCARGYQLSGPSSTQCRRNGAWSVQVNTVSCKVVKCPVLTVARLVKTSPSGCVTSQMKYNTKCLFSCPQGYQLQGPSYKQCGANGQWTNSAKLCTTPLLSSLVAELRPKLTVACGQIANVLSCIAQRPLCHLIMACDQITNFPSYVARRLLSYLIITCDQNTALSSDEARICVKQLHGVDDIRADEAIEYNQTIVQSDEAIEYNRTIVQSDEAIEYNRTIVQSSKCGTGSILLYNVTKSRRAQSSVQTSINDTHNNYDSKLIKRYERDVRVVAGKNGDRCNEISTLTVNCGPKRGPQP
ncbi:hypothetical protein ACROYT_G026436 [Oculina patagonica]